MSALTLKKRDTSKKGNQLRREGLLPTIVYGKHLEASISTCIEISAIEKFVKKHNLGARVLLDIDGKKQSAQLKDIQRDPLSAKLIHADFVALTEGEATKTSAHLVFLNKEKVSAGLIVNELIHEIEFECLPKNMIEDIEIDLGNLEVGASITVDQIELLKDSKYHLITTPDTVIVSISAPKTETSEAVESENAEVPLVGAEA